MDLKRQCRCEAQLYFTKSKFGSILTTEVSYLGTVALSEVFCSPSYVQEDASTFKEGSLSTLPALSEEFFS